MLNRKIHKIKVLFVIVCILQLFYIFHFRSGFQYEVIKNPLGENSGLFYAVSPEVIESKNILKKHKAIDFNLSAGLKEDTYFYQRFIEFNYPIRINLKIKPFRKTEKDSKKFSPIPAEEIQAQIKIKPNKFNIPVIL